MGFLATTTPVAYPVNDTRLSEAERGYLKKLADNAASQDLTEDLRPHVRNLSIAFTVFASAVVGLRFFARYRQAARIGVDDWLILASLAVLVGNMVMNLELVEQGLGLHSGALTLEQLQKLDQTIVGAEIIYVTGVNLYKLSLLFFYFRVFPLRAVRLGGYICGGISTAWCVACILAATFQCTPRERLWKPWIKGTCINLFLTQLCISVPSILCDIAILCLPLPHVLRLKTTLSQRILLMLVFLLGSYVVFTSVYRFRIFLLYTTNDVPYSLADGCAWNVIEISSGIVSTCLPTLGPLVRDTFKLAWPTSLAGSKKHTSQSKGSGIITIGGTGGRRNHTGTGLKSATSQGSQWNRLNDSDEDMLARSRAENESDITNEIELEVPKHKKGEPTAHVVELGDPPGARVKGQAAVETGDPHARTIRVQTDLEWKVEDGGNQPY